MLVDDVIYHGVDFIKLFLSNFTCPFCKLDHFKDICNIDGIAMKRSSLQNRVVSKFMPKFFMRWTQGVFPMTNALAYFGENSEKKFWNFVCSPTNRGKKGCQQCWDSSLNKETKKNKVFSVLLGFYGWGGLVFTKHLMIIVKLSNLKYPITK